MESSSPRLVPVTLLLALLILASVTPQSAVSQARSADAEVPAPTDLPYPDGRPVLLNPPASVFKPRPASELAPHRYLGTDWAPIIDATWGPSPLTIPQMLSVFDNFWTQIDQDFACFQDLDVDWTALRDRYRPEIAGGVSRGRFAAIMGHLSLALQESHTRIADLGVTRFTFPDPGVPLFYIGNWGDDRHFAAGLTPLPDSSLLVYEAIHHTLWDSCRGISFSATKGSRGNSSIGSCWLPSCPSEVCGGGGRPVLL
jgi:hypothetical protein